MTTEVDFNFGEFVTGLVVEAVKHSPSVQDALYREVVSTIDDVMKDSSLNDKFVSCPEFEEVKDALLESEQDLDDIDEDLSDLEERVSAIEAESILAEDFEALEQDYLRLQKTMDKYLPLLDALNRAVPLLRMIGLVKDIESHVPRHPIHKHNEQMIYSAHNWMS